METDANSGIDKFVNEAPYEKLDLWIRFVIRFAGKRESSGINFALPLELKFAQQLKDFELLEIITPQCDELQTESTVHPPLYHNMAQMAKSTVILRCDPNVLLEKLEEKRDKEVETRRLERKKSCSVK